MALGSTQPLTENEYQEYFLEGKGGRCVRLKTLPPSCAGCLEIWERQPPRTLRTCPGLALPLVISSVMYVGILRRAGVFFTSCSALGMR